MRTVRSGQPCSKADSPSTLHVSSVDLLLQAQAGDREALNALFSRYLPGLKQWASGRLPRWARDISDTTDLVQDVLLQTFKRIDLFTPEREGALQAYLRSAVLNRIRDEYRRERRRGLHEPIDEERLTDAPAAFDLVDAAEKRARYEAALQRLRPEDRDLVVSRIELGMSYEEIARVAEKPTPNAARSAVVRAVVRLSEELRAIHGRNRPE